MEFPRPFCHFGLARMSTCVGTKADSRGFVGDYAGIQVPTLLVNAYALECVIAPGDSKTKAGYSRRKFQQFPEKFSWASEMLAAIQERKQLEMGNMPIVPI